jgi:hypothetical protein
MKRSTILLAVVLISTALCLAQAPAPNAPGALGVQVSTTNPNDVKDIPSILNACYDVISGPAGQKRDWDRMRSLFWPGARLMPVGLPPEKTSYQPRILTVEEYITRAEPRFAQDGFFENSIANRVEQWAQIAHVFSTYESRHAKGEAPFARGINSFQLFNDGQRWWILGIMWEGESQKNPLPEAMLTAPTGK